MSQTESQENKDEIIPYQPSKRLQSSKEDWIIIQVILIQSKA